MSEPAAIIAKVNITPEAYDRFLNDKSPALAETMYADSRDKDGEFFVCISEQNTDNTIAPIPNIPEMPLDTVMTFRMDQQEFEKWYIVARRKFLDEAERLHNTE